MKTEIPATPGFVILLPAFSSHDPPELATNLYTGLPVFTCTRGAARRRARTLPSWISAFAVCPATLKDGADGKPTVEVNNVGAEWEETAATAR